MNKNTISKNRGATFVLISAFFYATYGIWSRLMSSSFGIFSQAWTRGLILLFFTLLFNFFFKFFKPILKKDLIWFVVIGLCGGLNQAPYFFGFKHLNVGTATLLFYSALLVGGYLIGKLSFGEKINKIKLISLGLAIVGMIIIYQLVLNPSQFLAAGLTILAGLMGAGGVVFSKKLSGSYPEIQIMTSYFVSMLVINFVLSWFLKDPLPSLGLNSNWLFQLGYTVAFLVANLAVIEGFKHLEPSIGSLIGLVEILFGIIFGVIFFGEIVGVGTVIGGILIIVSAVLPNIGISFRKNK